MRHPVVKGVRRALLSRCGGARGTGLLAVAGAGRHTLRPAPLLPPSFRPAVSDQSLRCASTTGVSGVSPPSSSSLDLEIHRASLGRTWDGFGEWRANPLREDVFWGEDGASSSSRPASLGGEGEGEAPLAATATLAACGKQVLETADPFRKALLTHEAQRAFSGLLAEAEAEAERVGQADAPDEPARPEKPALVAPKLCPSPKASGLPLNVYMLHNLAHIELNAVDLAWDTIVSYSGARLPLPFYLDFLRVADDESRHLRWCLQRLAELGSSYGCLPSHNLLWEAGRATKRDLLGRLVAIPMVQEARGASSAAQPPPLSPSQLSALNAMAIMD